MLSSHRMREAIAELRRRFKFIVIDSPPIMAATDAVILSALTDGVLLVVRSGETPKEAFTRTRDLLAAVKCRLLGRGAECRRFKRAGLLLFVPLLSVRVRLRIWRRSRQDVPISNGVRGITRTLYLGDVIMRYLITGGAGFIGSHLAEALAESRRRSFHSGRSFHRQRRKYPPSESQSALSLLFRFDHEQALAGRAGGRIRRDFSSGGGRGRAPDCGKPGAHDRNQRARHADSCSTRLRRRKSWCSPPPLRKFTARATKFRSTKMRIWCWARPPRGAGVMRHRRRSMNFWRFPTGKKKNCR